MTVPISLGFLRGQVRHLRARGWRVSVVTSPGPELAAFAAEEGCDAYALPMARALSPGADLVALARLVRLLRDLRPDIVHAHTPKGGLLGMLGATATGVPVRVFHLRGSLSLTAVGWRRSLFRATERVTCGLAHGVLSVGHSLRDALAADGVVDPARVEVLLGGSGQGVDARGRFHPSRVPRGATARVRGALGIPFEAYVFVYVGRLVRDKGVVELQRAWARVRDPAPDARLLVVGPAEARDALPADVLDALERDPSVHRLGALPQSELPSVYASAQVLVLPTYREGFPNVVLEASAMRLPVLATRVVGCVDAVVDGVTGTLVPPRDPDALAEAMLAYLGDRQRGAEQGVAGRKRVLREFERSAFPAAVESYYVRLAASLGRPL